MTDELGREKLLKWARKFYDLWNQGLHSEGDIEKANYAHRQIVALIQKPGITEEWIQEKARTLCRMADVFDNIEATKVIIRKLVESIPAKKVTVDEEFVWKMVEESVYILHQDKHIFFQRKLTEAGVEVRK